MKPKSKIILSNKIKCKKCGEIIKSKTSNELKRCKCGSVAVDGGKDYLKRIGNENDYIEKTTFKD